MPVEIRGTQLMIRLKEPDLFRSTSFRSMKFEGTKGIWRILAKLKKDNTQRLQSIRINLAVYQSALMLEHDLLRIKKIVSEEKYMKIRSLVQWFYMI